MGTTRVPVCTNDAALAAGDELVYATAAKTWMQEEDAVDCARAAKKPRH